MTIDELGFVPLSPTGAELLFEVFSQRYEWGSILVTTWSPPTSPSTNGPKCTDFLEENPIGRATGLPVAGRAGRC